MFASLVNYYKVNEIEKSNSNNENSRQMNKSDVFSPSTVASLRRQPLQEISLDLLRKQQTVTRAQNINIAAAEITAIDAVNEKLIAEQEKYRANKTTVVSCYSFILLIVSSICLFLFITFCFHFLGSVSPRCAVKKC